MHFVAWDVQTLEKVVNFAIRGSGTTKVQKADASIAELTFEEGNLAVY